MERLAPRTIRSGPNGPAVLAVKLLLTLAAMPVMIFCIVVYDTGWRAGDPFLRGLIWSAVALFTLAYAAWRLFPVRKAELTFDQRGLTLGETQNGMTRVASQTIAWSEIYALLGTDHKAFFGVELHTNGPPPGRRIMMPIQGGPQIVAIARPYAKAAGYRIKPVFTKGFMSQEIWRLLKD
ncbi:hypothetical protein [Yoonia algicola]|uniref:PH domain-containing protein n=1 Tax=Yoonia algicola TaxID=3137368 RepID=A0AAN0M9P6_9RHOB